MKEDEAGNVTGGMYGASPIGQALAMAQQTNRLAGIAQLLRYATMMRGGVGSPGISPKAVMRSPQATQEGNQLPSLADLYENIPMRGQPRGQDLRTPIPGQPKDVIRAGMEEHGLPSQPMGPGQISEGLQRASAEPAGTQLKMLQDLINRIFMGQSRQ